MRLCSCVSARVCSCVFARVCVCTVFEGLTGASGVSQGWACQGVHKLRCMPRCAQAEMHANPISGERIPTRKLSGVNMRVSTQG